MKKNACLFIVVFFMLSFIYVSGGSTTTTLSASVPTPAVELDKWQKYWLERVEEFRAENLTLNPEQRYIVFLGDSLTKGLKVKDYFPQYPALNRGIVADGVCNFPSAKLPYRGITNRMKESIFDCNPSHLFFLIGTNDVGNRNIPLDYWFNAYKSVIEQTQQKFPDVIIILVTCPPTGVAYKNHINLNSRILEWNTIIRNYAREKSFRLIDLYELLVDQNGYLPSEMTRDGLHFNQMGYDRWVEKIRVIIEEK